MKKERGLLSTIAIMSLFILATGQVIINPALQGISAQFNTLPYATVALLATVPNLAVAVVSLLTGIVAGKKLSLKVLAAAACILFAVGGVLPIFLQSFAAYLAARALFGIGVGIATPLGNMMILKNYADEKRASMLGYGSSVMCFAGVIYQTVSGIVATANVDNVWLVHLASVIPLLLMLFFYQDAGTDKAEQKSTFSAGTFHKKAFAISCLFAIVFMLFYPVMLNMSVIVADELSGTAATTGLIQTMYTVGGALGGIVFGWLRRRTKQYAKCITLGMAVLGMALCGFAKHPIFLSVGTFFCGLGIFMTSSEVLYRISRMVAPAALSFSTGMMMSIWNIGTFASTGYMRMVEKFAGASPRLPIQIGAAALLLILLGWTLLDSKRVAK